MDKVDAVRFTRKDEETVLTLAAVASVALERSWLYTKSSERERWLTATRELTATLLHTVPLPDPFRVIAEHLAQAAQGAGSAVVLCEVPDERFPILLSSGSAPTYIVDKKIFARLTAGLPRRDAAHADPPGLHTQLPTGPSLTTSLSVGDHVIGAAVVSRQLGGPEFNDQDLRMAQALASQAAVALEHLQAQQLNQLLAVSDDRNRIARELHDQVIQHLFGIGLRIQALMSRPRSPSAVDEVDVFVDQIDKTIRDIRRIIFSLRDQEGSASGLRSKILRIATDAPLDIDPRVYFDGPIDSAVPPEIHQDALIVLGEMLVNVARHARARRVDIFVDARLEDRRFSLVVRDDGIGHAVHQVLGSGLSNMRERAEARGGSFRVDAQPSAGTTVEWVVPLPRRSSSG